MKERVDVLLYQQGFAPSRQRAKYLIESGCVQADGRTVTKAGAMVEENVKLTVSGQDIPYVSRGGLKLEKALRVFPVSVRGKVCLDVGASTGGFTDCLLQHGAARVYALDSGHGQLSPVLSMRDDVVNLEGINAKDLQKELFPEPPQIVTADVSFISLQKVLPAMREVSAADAQMVCLVKPQFEAGRTDVGKHGVVKDPKVHIRVLQEVTAFAVQTGLYPVALDFSPVRGPEGNIEYLLCLKKEGTVQIGQAQILQTVDASHRKL